MTFKLVLAHIRNAAKTWRNLEMEALRQGRDHDATEYRLRATALEAEATDLELEQQLARKPKAA